ncbi:DEAD/DEAH box helicase [Pelagibius litoralis]|uniref:DEAD-box ATP-dependent RNA helicase RhpA n=1 Tax=Pelagibius litoralis TaxID=374515 RepID=A0A967C9W1_9PROT|nr:DEAD/DEAH box helicase [Pelagibius litoralis]NIA67243.1 DEAD/DEAH box helicase [Pelagibius litoralis]
MTFEDLGLSPEVLKAVEEVGYTTPTPIQEKAIPVVLMGRDVLGCAQTGTGKTAGFTLPMIDILSSGRARARMPRSLIIAPTRELAAQVSENFELYGKYGKLSMALLIGGSSFVEQEQKLDRGVDVLIATPGRLIDLFERGKILLADVKILVIDEADRMLDMGFMPDVERIVGLLPKIRQTLFFSATMPPEIRRLADAFLMNPKAISVDPPASAAETVTQGLVKVKGAAKEKRAALRALAKSEDVKSALVFCNRKRDVDIVFRSMERHGFSVAALHGDMAQPVRMETLQSFKDAKVQFLVCSDVAARGLDIPAVSHVFNFDVPSNPEDYVHRIGRTGRAGRSGKAFTLALREEGKYLANVVRMLGMDIPEVTLEQDSGWEAGEAEEAKPGRSRRGSSRSGEGSRRGGSRRSGRRSQSNREETVASETVAEETAPSATPANDVAANAAAESPEEVVTLDAAVEPKPRPAARSKAREQKREPRRGKPKQESDSLAPGETAFGDHIPAFLLRPAKVA